MALTPSILLLAILAACAVGFTIAIIARWRAPYGYQDRDGFHSESSATRR